MKKRKLLIISATHGNEGFSIPVVKKLSKKFNFDWIIGNPKALTQKTRFFETDLNRSGPGNGKSKLYEERRAKAIINKARGYDAIIDLHGTVSNTGIFLILSDPNWQNIELAKRIDLKNVVLWPSLKSTGPMTQFIPNSLEIECGPQYPAITAKKLIRVLQKFLSGENRKRGQSYYIVTGKLKGNPKINLKDFKEALYKGRSFYPLMVGQYPGIKCYMMQKLSDTL